MNLPWQYFLIEQILADAVIANFVACDNRQGVFTNIFKTYYQVLNVNALQRIADGKKLNDDVLNAESLKKLGLIKSIKKPIKVLGKGEIKAKVTLKVDAFSAKAKEKIEAAGGSVKKI